jgi:adenylate cyclase
MNWAKKHRLDSKLLMYSGWILYFYAFTHLLNHSMGILGLQTLEGAREIFIAFWRLPVLEWLVITCLVIHFVFVMYKLFTKSTYKGLSGTEWTQIVLGLIIPVLLVVHIFETKIPTLLFDTNDSYSYYLYWQPDWAIVTFILLVIVIWWHGCLGMLSFANQKRWYHGWRNWLSGVAVGLPILAICGTIAAMREVNRLAIDPAWTEMVTARDNPRNIDLFKWEESWSIDYVLYYMLFVLFFFLSRKVVRAVKKRRSGITVKYLDGTLVSITQGASLLEASLQANIPHAHVCGGRGRCSTCRVQILDGIDEMPEASADEVELLNKVGSGSAVRLACRTRPVSDCTIHPLLLPNVTVQQSLWRKQSTGIDKTVAILFCDLRGFTSMAEEKLPYDVVFVLNQYFQTMGHEIERHHGRIDKFIGDAIMAVFGIYREPKQACQDALMAVYHMRMQLDKLNAQLKSELPEVLQMGFGIHCGHVIIGEMGYKDSQNFVAIGDATNTASRLESLTKDYNCELIISQDAAVCAEMNFEGYEMHLVEIRGRQKPIQVYAIRDIKNMYLTSMEAEVAG